MLHSAAMKFLHVIRHKWPFFQCLWFYFQLDALELDREVLHVLKSQLLSVLKFLPVSEKTRFVQQRVLAAYYFLIF